MMHGRSSSALVTLGVVLCLQGCGRLGYGSDAGGALDGSPPVVDGEVDSGASMSDGGDIDAGTFTDGGVDADGGSPECMEGVACVVLPGLCLGGTTACVGGVADCAVGDPLAAGTTCGSGTCDLGGICELESGTIVTASTSLALSVGISLATDGATIAAGAWNPYNLSATGAVVVFERVGGAGWRETAFLEASDATSNDGFGASVAIQGDTLLVGARRRRNGARYAGAIYVFERIGGTWTEIQIIEPPNVEAVNFGSAVAIDGTRAVATAHLGMIGGGWGSGYILERNTDATWSIVATMTSPGADSLGWSADIDGDRVVLGSLWTTDTSGMSASDGAVHVFERAAADSWVETATLFPPTPSAPAGFYASGSTVALEGDRIAMGDTLAEVTDRSNGAIVIWELIGGTWSPVQTLTDVVINRDASFGRSIILNGDELVSSAVDYDMCNLRVTTFHRVDGTWLPVRVNHTPAAVGCSDGQAVEGHYIDIDIVRAGSEILIGYPLASGLTGGGGLVVTAAE